MRVIDVLVVADDGDAHGDAVLAELEKLGLQTARFNLSDVRARFNLSDVRATELSARPGALDLGGGDLADRVTAATTVWWRRSGVVQTPELDEEESRLAWDECPHILRGALSSSGVRWVDEPFDVERAELKLFQLQVAETLGVSAPASLVTNDEDEARRFGLERRVVAKALSPGIGIAPFVAEVDGNDFAVVAALPVFLQERVEATADLRVVAVGSECWVWRRARGADTLDWRAEDPQGVGFRRVQDELIERCSLQITSALRLSMSVQDWLETDNGPVFLEVNPQGAWLFLDEAPTIVTSAVAHHLAGTAVVGEGTWPRAIKRFLFDFLPAKRAPNNDGVVAPQFRRPDWANEVAARPPALEAARRAHDEAKSGAQVAEEKGNRLVQVALTLLAIALGLLAFQLQRVGGHGWAWSFSLLPIAVALVCLALAAFEALEIDRVGVYSHPSGERLAGLGVQDPIAVLIAEEEIGRQLARWSSRHKHTDLMRARAWFSRGLAALIVAGILGAATWSALSEGSDGSMPTTPVVNAGDP